MRAAQVSLQDVMEAIGKSNLNVGGKVIEENGMEFVVRGLGLIQSVGDIESIVLIERNGTPIYLRDVATVQIGGDFRRGALDVDGKEVVGGIVVMRTGENAMEVIRRVKAKIAQISTRLPAGVQIKSFYDRSELVDRTIDTLKHALTEEVILVTLAHIIFLFHFRSILIVTIPLPVSILMSFILMKQFGITSNIMSLSGIAIAIGVLVDAAIVMTENVIRHCEHAEEKKGARLNAAETLQVTLDASHQVGRPIFFAMVIIILAFVPVFSLTGQEGKLFHPLAFTKTFSMVGATILSVTLVPVLCSLLIGGKIRGEEANPVMRALVSVYRPMLGWALRHRALTLGMAVLVVAGAVALIPRIGKEFMLPLNEGDLMFMPISDPAISLPQAIAVTQKQNEAIQNVPEVASVVAKISRAATSTDPAPVNMTETIVSLKPESAWRPGMTREKLIAELDQATTLPGVSNIWTQPIINRINMLTTGIRSEVGVKIFGHDLNALQERAQAVAEALKKI